MAGLVVDLPLLIRVVKQGVFRLFVIKVRIMIGQINIRQIMPVLVIHQQHQV